LLSFVFLLSLAFSQDSLHMRFVGSWECPSDDLGGGGEYFARVRKILDDYLVLGALDGDSLWILDVSDPSSPSVALCYADTAFSDEPAKIEGFEVKKDSGYIYVAYRKPESSHDIYVRVLRLVPNPVGIEKGMVIDAPDNILPAGYLVGDSFLVGCAGLWNVDGGDTLIPVSCEIERLGWSYPPDGLASSRVVMWWGGVGDSFFVDVGYINPAEWTDSSTYPMCAAYLKLGKQKLYSATACSVIIYGTWRTAYDDEMPTAAGVSEEHGFVVLGTDGPVFIDDSTGVIDSVIAGLYFVDIDSIIESYPCMPRVRFCMRGSAVGDIVVRSDLLYVRYRDRTMVVYNISDYPDIDTVAYYCCDTRFGYYVHTEIDGKYIYEFFSFGSTGELHIFELDSIVGVQGRIEREEELRIYPNPVFADIGRVRIVPQGVEGYAVDINGRVVRKIEHGKMNIKNLSPGIYLLKLNLGGKIVTKKLLVM